MMVEAKVEVFHQKNVENFHVHICLKIAYFVALKLATHALSLYTC